MAPKLDHFGTIEARLKRNYIIVDGCWCWLGMNNRGYGKIWHKRKVQEAHRVSYELAKGPIQDGMVLDHLCRIPCCINPEHLEPVTIAENIRRGKHHHRELTHCKRGHEFTAENTLILSAGWRACRACASIRIKDWRKRTAQTGA